MADNTIPSPPPKDDETVGGKRSAWMTHVKKTMRANKGKPLSAVLKMAKKTYKKTAKKSRRGGGAGSGGPGASTAASVGGRRHGKKKSSSRSRKH